MKKNNKRTTKKEVKKINEIKKSQTIQEIKQVKEVNITKQEIKSPKGNLVEKFSPILFSKSPSLKRDSNKTQDLETTSLQVNIPKEKEEKSTISYDLVSSKGYVTTINYQSPTDMIIDKDSFQKNQPTSKIKELQGENPRLYYTTPTSIKGYDNPDSNVIDASSKVTKEYILNPKQNKKSFL